jgi:hypothetical protein
MASPFQPTKAQATTGRPVKGIVSMPQLGAGLPMQSKPPSSGTGPKPAGAPAKSFASPTPNKMAGAFTHEQRGGAAPVAATQGINTHSNVPHVSMHPSKGQLPSIGGGM